VKRNKNYNNLLSNNIRDANRRSTKKFESEGESTMEYKLGRIIRGKVSTEPIAPQNLFVILNNKVMSME
jgi:hypothetical protein